MLSADLDDDRPGWFKLLRVTSPALAQLVSRVDPRLEVSQAANVRPTPAEEAAFERVGDGTERPEALPPAAGPQLIERSFAFLDLSGFTEFTDMWGEQAAVEILVAFRGVLGEVAARRGVRISKFLGDGAMVVGVEPGPLIAAAAEMLARFADTELSLRVGLAHGPVILILGDDHVGRAVNLASRLCDIAADNEIVAAETTAVHAPDWIHVSGPDSVTVRGVGDVPVRRLSVSDEVHLPAPSAATEAQERQVRAAAAARRR